MAPIRLDFAGRNAKRDQKAHPGDPRHPDERCTGSQRDPGEFRRTQNWIGTAGSTLQTARFFPPGLSDMLAALDNLEKSIYQEGSQTPPLVKIGLIHAQFETIHPFLDGNGRMGRLPITLLMCHYRLLGAPLLYLSYFFRLNRSEYYDRLQAIRERGDWKRRIRFFLERIRSVATEATQKARAVLNLPEADRQRIRDELGRRVQSGVSVRSVEKITELSYSNANALVAEMGLVGILRPVGEQMRNKLFVYQDYLSIFTLDPSKADDTNPDATYSGSSQAP